MEFTDSYTEDEPKKLFLREDTAPFLKIFCAFTRFVRPDVIMAMIIGTAHCIWRVRHNGHDYRDSPLYLTCSPLPPMVNWHRSKQGIRWPVSLTHIGGSNLELMEVMLTADKVLVSDWMAGSYIGKQRGAVQKPVKVPLKLNCFRHNLKLKNVWNTQIQTLRCLR